MIIEWKKKKEENFINMYDFSKFDSYVPIRMVQSDSRENEMKSDYGNC